MIFVKWKLPDYLNRDFMRGYEAGYESAKQDMKDFLETIPRLTDTTSTQIIDDNLIGRVRG